MLEDLRNRILSEMGMGKLLSNKRVFYSALALVLYFFVYLIASNIAQNKAVADTYYVDKFLNLGSQIGTNNRVLIAELDFYRRGGVDRLQAKIPAIDEFVSPAKPYIEDIIGHLRNDDIMAASASFNYTSSLLQKERERSLDRIRYFRLIAANIAILLFLFAIVPSILKLYRTNNSRSGESSVAARIASEGLFSLDENFQIDGVLSSAPLTKMFGQEQKLDGDFFKFIGPLVDNDVVQSTKDYLEGLSHDSLATESQEELNPLRHVEVWHKSKRGKETKSERRYLAFDFKRVISEDDSEEEPSGNLLVSIKDESHLYKLKQELQNSKEDQEAQLDLLVRVQSLNRRELNGFFKTAKTLFSKLANTLESDKDSAVKKEEIEDVAEELIDLKTYAGHLGFYKFESISHSLHDELADLRLEKKIVDETVQPATEIVNSLVAEIENMQVLATEYSISSANRNTVDEIIVDAQAEEVAFSAGDEDEESLDDFEVPVLELLAKTVSQKHDKQAKLVCYGMEPDNIPESVDTMIHQIAAQLVKNSIVHGCQSTKIRRQAGKTDFINICVRYSQLEDAHLLIVRDDGEGFDKDEIVKQAIKRNLIKSDQVEGIDSQQALRLAFHPDYSSHSEADINDDNVSLSTLRREIKEAGGKISLRHRSGEFSKFQVTIPK